MAKRRTKLVKGCKVRLKYDITTRGGVKFRAGLVMRVEYFETHRVDLRVWVRAKPHDIRLEKKAIDSHLEVVWSPPDAPQEEKENGNHDHE